MISHKEALELAKGAENVCLAAMFDEAYSGTLDNEFVPITDSSGRWLTKAEVREKFLRGDDE